MINFRNGKFICSNCGWTTIKAKEARIHNCSIDDSIARRNSVRRQSESTPDLEIPSISIPDPDPSNDSPDFSGGGGDFGGGGATGDY